MKCSIVVPVWNPGPSLTRCVESLLAQTMSPSDYEIVMVDDGSTDGTGALLDTLAATHSDRIRVTHIPASGWPGRPRNVGIDAARGDYIQLVDNDDVLPPYALDGLYEAAMASDADIVIGKPASDFRGINHTFYRHTRRGLSLRELPDVIETLTPHKMFRRAFLDNHRIRFPEGVPLEDQIFMVTAYAQARSITVLADRCYYYYLRRLGSGRNAGDRELDPAIHIAAVEQILDEIDAQVAEPALHDQLARRFYRTELINRLWSAGAISSPQADRQAMFDEVRRVAVIRFSSNVRDGAPAAYRTMGQLVERDDAGGAFAFADQHRRIAPRPQCTDTSWTDGALTITCHAPICLGSDPLRWEAVGAGRGDSIGAGSAEGIGAGWAVPAELAPTIPIDDRKLDDDRDRPDAELLLVSRIDGAAFGLGAGLDDGLRITIDDHGEAAISGVATIDPATALAGSPLTAGLWDLRLRSSFAGINRTRSLRLADGVTLTAGIAADGSAVRPFTGGKPRTLTLDVGQWAKPLAASLAKGAELDAEWADLDAKLADDGFADDGALAGDREMAADGTLAGDGAGRLRLSVPLALAAPTTASVIFQPEGDADETGEAPIAPTCTVSLVDSLVDGAAGRAEAVFCPPEMLTGRWWRPWLQLDPTGVMPPARLPWRVTRTDGTTRAVRDD